MFQDNNFVFFKKKGKISNVDFSSNPFIFDRLIDIEYKTKSFHNYFL